jgi:hypothetical protein
VVSALPPSDSEGLSRQIVLQIFSSIGRCRFLEERHFDASTALSGCGPAFACIFLEAMADGGVMMGLPRAEALELASQCACLNTQFDATICDSFTKHCKALLAWLCSLVRIQLRSRTPSQVSN